MTRSGYAWQRGGRRIRLSDRSHLFVVVAAFVLSRVIVYARGVHFQSLQFDHYWQYIGESLLRDRLWESVFYLHSQPPLFNLFLGLVVKLAPTHVVAALAVLFKLMGLIISILVYALMRQIGLRAWLATVMTIACVVSPPFLYFENYLFYEYPTLLLLCAAAVALHRFLATGRAPAGVLAFAVMATVVLTRSLFQVVWLVCVVVAVAACCRVDTRKRIVRVAVAPIIVVLALYVKNLVLFGTFTTSSWFGMNLMSEVTVFMPAETHAALLQSGTLSPFFAIKPFSSVATYRPYVPELPHTGVAILDDEFTTAGTPNFHHRMYAAVSRHYAADAVRIMWREPWLLVRGWCAAASLFFRPASDFEYFRGFGHRLLPWQRLYHTAVYGAFFAPPWSNKETPAEAHDLRALVHRIGWFILIGMPLLIWHGISQARVAVAARDEARAGTLTFMVVTIIYLTVVAIGLNVGENQRYRFLLDAFLWVLFASALQSSFRRFTDRP